MRVIVGLVRPRVAGVQHVGVHLAQRLGHRDVEHGVRHKLRVVDGAVQDGVNAGARHGDVQAATLGEGATAPASVHEVGVAAVLAHESSQELGVDEGVVGHEDSAEAGAKGGCWLLHAQLGARDLGSVATQEVVACLQKGWGCLGKRVCWRWMAMGGG